MHQRSLSFAVFCASWVAVVACESADGHWSALPDSTAIAEELARDLPPGGSEIDEVPSTGITCYSPTSGRICRFGTLGGTLEIAGGWSLDRQVQVGIYKIANLYQYAVPMAEGPAEKAIVARWVAVETWSPGAPKTFLSMNTGSSAWGSDLYLKRGATYIQVLSLISPAKFDKKALPKALSFPITSPYWHGSYLTSFAEKSPGVYMNDAISKQFGPAELPELKAAMIAAVAEYNATGKCTVNFPVLAPQAAAQPTDAGALPSEPSGTPDGGSW